MKETNMLWQRGNHLLGLFFNPEDAFCLLYA
jgi:hypothetical protein